MLCPYCKALDSRVIDSRLISNATVTWRRRECDGCKRRFTTYERVERSLPAIVKKSGERQPFNRDKVLRSLRIACSKRPVSLDELDSMADAIEQELSLLGEKEISSHKVGESVMVKLKDRDEVAYVRFASVYKSFRDIDEFMAEVGSLVAKPTED